MLTLLVNDKVHTFRLDSYGWSVTEMADHISFVINRLNNPLFIGCNIVKFDIPHINRLLNNAEIFPDIYTRSKSDGYIVSDHVLDLQVLSRLIWFERPGGHSVEAWSKKFGKHKPEIEIYDDPSMIEEYVRRCEADVDITKDIWDTLKRHYFNPSFKSSIEVEHVMAIIAQEMETNGFGFNLTQAERLRTQIERELEILSNDIIAHVGDVVDEVRTYTLKRNKDGQLSAKTYEVLNGIDTGFQNGDKFYKTFYRPFNPGSPKDRIDFLNSCGWKPTDKTKTHKSCERELQDAAKRKDWAEVKRHQKRLERFAEYGWEVSEDNLETLPKDAPEAARKLTEWLTLNGRLTHLKTWLSCTVAGERPGEGIIHGGFLHIGAWTGRMSHHNPNQGNIFGIPHLPKGETIETVSPVMRVKLKYDKALRTLWKAKPGRILVGTDAEGIQLRVLAHYMNDPEYSFAVANGRKEDKTDVHNVNLRALGLSHITRDHAKTFI